LLRWLSSAPPLSALDEEFLRFERPWIEVGSVYRRICFLRLEGRKAEADRIERTEFKEAEARARETAPSQSDADSLLSSLVADERERVAGAIAFAEVLVPMLMERLRAAPEAPPSPAVPGRARRTGAPAEGRGIADFIDEMIADDRSHSPLR
jgi:hypothetical protein